MNIINAKQLALRFLIAILHNIQVILPEVPPIQSRYKRHCISDGMWQ